MKVSKVDTNRNEMKWDGYRIHWEEKSKPLRHHLIILTQQFIPLLLSHSIERIEPLTRMNHSNRWDNSYVYFSNEPLDAWDTGWMAPPLVLISTFVWQFASMIEEVHSIRVPLIKYTLSHVCLVPIHVLTDSSVLHPLFTHSRHRRHAASSESVVGR